MPEYPLLPLPSAEAGELPKIWGGARDAPNLSPRRQAQRLGPTFARLRASLAPGREGASLRRDPSSIAPERALVLDVAGSLVDFLALTRRVRGLEFLDEQEIEFEPDEDFFELDTRKGKEGQRRTDKRLGGRLYLAMPDRAALGQILSLWERWRREEDLLRGWAGWRDVFASLRDIRPWGPRDRIVNETLSVWRERVQADSPEIMRIEAELWFRESPALRQTARRSVEAAVAEAGGEIVHRATINEIRYDAMLVDLPGSEIERMIAREEIHLAICDDVMFLRPQSSIEFSEPDEEAEAGLAPPHPAGGGPPVAALLDGIPVQNHALLAGRLDVDDPDDIEGTVVVANRAHGTAMASLILHGDRNLDEPPLSRQLHVRPILTARGNGLSEAPPRDRLLVDLIYRAVLRMKEGEAGAEPTAPDVFLVNLSVCDASRPFASVVSPLAKLLDHLADRYGILFLVSAGNIASPLVIGAGDFPTWTDFEDAAPEKREEATLRALAANKAYRTLLSPAEALNVVTVGALHCDAASPPRGANAVDPYTSNELPNVSSALGLGHLRVVKPDILMPGGSEHVTWRSSGGALKISPGGRYGLKAATPSAAGGALDRESLSAGTSAATALATRAGHRIFDALMDRNGGSRHADMDRGYYAVVVKALLLHRAEWGERAGPLDRIYGPHGPGKHVARRDNIARLLGYGFPNIEEAIACAANRATLVGFGSVRPRHAAVHAIPLPPSLERVPEPRAITVTLAWFSPVNPRHRAYRQAKLEVDAVTKLDMSAGVNRLPGQPSDKSTPRGTVFHTRYEGHRAIPFIDDGHIRFRVSCREPAGALDRNIRYGMAVTIEAGAHIPVYREVRARLAVPVAPAAP